MCFGYGNSPTKQRIHAVLQANGWRFCAKRQTPRPLSCIYLHVPFSARLLMLNLGSRGVSLNIPTINEILSQTNRNFLLLPRSGALCERPWREFKVAILPPHSFLGSLLSPVQDATRDLAMPDTQHVTPCYEQCATTQNATPDNTTRNARHTTTVQG